MEIVSTLCKKCRRRENHCLTPEQKVRRALVAKPIAAAKFCGSRQMIKPSRHGDSLRACVLTLTRIFWALFFDGQFSDQKSARAFETSRSNRGGGELLFFDIFSAAGGLKVAKIKNFSGAPPRTPDSRQTPSTMLHPIKRCAHNF